MKRNAKLFIKRHLLKIIVSSALFVLLFTSFLIMGTVALGSHPMEASADERVVIVNPGDTLWGIAKSSYSDDSHDIRYIIFMIKDRNGLESVNIKPGQKIIIPAI